MKGTAVCLPDQGLCCVPPPRDNPRPLRSRRCINPFFRWSGAPCGATCVRANCTWCWPHAGAVFHSVWRQTRAVRLSCLGRRASAA